MSCASVPELIFAIGRGALAAGSAASVPAEPIRAHDAADRGLLLEHAQRAGVSLRAGPPGGGRIEVERPARPRSR